MEESETDDTLTCSNILGRAGTGLCVDLDVLIKVNKVLDAFIVAILLDDCVDEELCCTGCIVVTCPDETLVLRICKVSEILWDIDSKSCNFILVVHDSKDTFVNTEPSVLAVLVFILYNMGGIHCVICFKEAFCCKNVVRICCTAEPYVS